jgi:hypothetical protein
MMEPDTPTRWSEAFTRTSRRWEIDYGKGQSHAWHNRYLLDVPSIPTRSHSAMFSGSGSNQDFADGGTEARHPYSFGTPSFRIYGVAAMRFLCHIHGIEEPARPLKGEPFKPDRELLIRAVLVDIHTEPSNQRATRTIQGFWELLADLHGMVDDLPWVARRGGDAA